MEQTWRWYGPADSVTLSDIKQAGATGIVTALHQVPIGDVWSVEDIKTRQEVIEAAGLSWSVVESIPVHESIKLGIEPDRRQYIENYQQSIKNLSIQGIDTLCYNFMPILDWTRTDLQFPWPDGSSALKFDTIHFAAFDLYILQRPGAVQTYSNSRQQEAKEYYDSLTNEEKKQLKSNIIAGMPGSMVESYSMEEFQTVLNQYEDVDAKQLRQNLAYFLQQVVPVAEQYKVRMALHPDDPPISLFGLPRVVCSAQDIRYVFDAVDSKYNGLTFCAGTFASRAENNVHVMCEEFLDRIHFVHLRNVVRQENGSFIESDHLEGEVDMYRLMTILLKEKNKRIKEGREDHRLPFRPDHGHSMLNDLADPDKTNPGYTAIGRLKGLAELRGLQMALIRVLELDFTNAKTA